jgi:hypothetical protein
MQLLSLPFFSELAPAETILLAGAGGGFDIFCGLPLYFGLKAAGKKVYLANLSFSHLPEPEESLSPSLLKVTADTPRPQAYFPEGLFGNLFAARRDAGNSEISLPKILIMLSCLNWLAPFLVYSDLATFMLAVLKKVSSVSLFGSSIILSPGSL